MNEGGDPAGSVVEAWRYPVVGLMGERLERAELDGSGLDGDRAVGLWDTVAERFLNVEECPALRLAQARTESNTVIGRLPDGGSEVGIGSGADAGIAANTVSTHAGTLGVTASVVRSGAIRLGDPVDPVHP